MAAETTYHYAVQALSADGDGAQSATINATTPAAPKQTAPKQTDDKPPPNRLTRAAPSAPQNLRFQVGDGSLTFIWGRTGHRRHPHPLQSQNRRFGRRTGRRCQHDHQLDGHGNLYENGVDQRHHTLLRSARRQHRRSRNFRSHRSHPICLQRARRLPEGGEAGLDREGEGPADHRINSPGRRPSAGSNLTAHAAW